ncbi:G protein-coupled receptor [Caenorhabditis elegans]|nr:G protein-coupled receptor [Caenorhabditis elegans]CTQ86940.1 G protein-coupled receptor [Caenorhabditis elegans]|eukprot:NP_001300241.1 Serpentine Receptor, class AB (class A-like) [Caenorhabditis elegans]
MISSDCSKMAEFATSRALQASLGLNLIIVIFAIPNIVYSMVFIATKHVFHLNTQLQILVPLFGLLLHSIGRLGLHSTDLVAYFGNWQDPCEIIPNFYRCLILRGFYNVGLALSSMCSVALVIERIVALKYSITYEYCGQFFGVLLVFLQIFLATCYLFSMYFHAAFTPGDQKLYYCQTIASSTGSVWFVIAPLYAVMIGQIASRIVFELLLRKNKALRNSVSLSLSTRFNLDQSIRSLRALKLLVNCNTLVFATLSVVTTTLHFNSSSLSKPNYIALVEAVHILPLYGIAVSVGVYQITRTCRALCRQLF